MPKGEAPVHARNGRRYRAMLRGICPSVKKLAHGCVSAVLAEPIPGAAAGVLAAIRKVALHAEMLAKRYAA